MAPQAHIAFVDDYPGATIGGGEQHLLRVAAACREWGYRVTVVCMPGSGLEASARSAGMEVAAVGLRGSWSAARDRLAVRFASLKPDIVHTHGFRAMLTGLDAARRIGVPYVLTTVHNMPGAPRVLRPGWRGEAEYRLRRYLWRKTFCCTDRFVCVVEGVRSELAEMGLEPGRAVVIRNGIPDPAAGRLAVPRDSSQVTVTSAGRLEPLKDFSTLVSAAAIVCAQRDGIRFRLVGDGSLRDSLETQARELGILDRFEFAGWVDDPIADIAAADIYAVSSVTDTTNLTLLEAMALSRPVVATAAGGIPDTVEADVTGRLVPPGNPQALASAIVELADDPALRQRMGDAGRARYEAEFTLERMLDAHRELYSVLLREGG